MTDVNGLAEQAEAHIVAGEFEPALQWDSFRTFRCGSNKTFLTPTMLPCFWLRPVDDFVL
jgi:hypothetical protein